MFTHGCEGFAEEGSHLRFREKFRFTLIERGSCAVSGGRDHLKSGLRETGHPVWSLFLFFLSFIENNWEQLGPRKAQGTIRAKKKRLVPLLHASL